MWNFLMKGGAVDIFGKGICGIGDGFCAAFHQTFQRLMGTIYQVLGLFADLMHIAFYILAGVDMKAGDNEYGMFDIELISSGERQNILDYFVFNEAVTKAYWILCGIGLLLIVVFTIYKIVKQDYFDRAGPRSKGPIFRNVAISAISFLLVIPIFYVIIHVSSLLAVAVMDAMGMNATTFAGAQIFQLSWDDNGEAMRTVNAMLMNYGNETTKYSASSFKWMLELDNDTIFILMSPEPKYVDYAPKLLEALHVESYDGGILTTSGKAVGNATFYWYIYLVGIVVAIKSLYKLLQAMLQRVFKILGLFIVAPSPISQYVLDDGTKFNSWLKQSIQEGLRLVVATMSFSIFLMVLKLVSDINFITPFQSAADAATQAESINVSTSLLAYNEEFANIPMLDDPAANGNNGLESMFYSLANAFMQVFIIMGAGGAISDLDPILSGLISGAGSSLEAGKTGEAAGAVGKAAMGLATRAAGAAVGGALSVAKGVAGTVVGGVAGAVKAGVNASESKLKDATAEADASSEDDSKEETSTATNVEENNTVNGGNTNEEQQNETVANVEENGEVTENDGEQSTEQQTGNDQEGAANQEANEQAGAATNNGTGAQSDNGQANTTGSENAANGNKPAAEKGNPSGVSKLQGRLKRRTNAKAVGNVLKGIFTGKEEIVKDKDGNVVKDKNGKPVKKVKWPGVKQVFGAAGGFLKALNLKQALVDSGLVSKDMVDNFETARDTNKEALDYNLVNPAVEAGKAGLSKAGGAIGGAWEEKKIGKVQAKMDEQIEKTETAQKHHAAMQNVEERSQALASANEAYTKASAEEEAQAKQYGELVEEQRVAEQKADEATSQTQVKYAANNPKASMEQKEKLNKYINGEITAEEVGEADLKAFKAAGADKAMAARGEARRAADIAENGEYKITAIHEDGTVEKELSRAGRQQYAESVVAKNQAAKDADGKLGALNNAIAYANKTSKEYNDLYTSTGTRGNYTTKDKTTGKVKVGTRDVKKGKLGETNARLEAFNKSEKVDKTVGHIDREGPGGYQEGISAQIARLQRESNDIQEEINTYDVQAADVETRKKTVSQEYDRSMAEMTHSWTDKDGKQQTSGPSAKVQSKLESIRQVKVVKLNKEAEDISTKKGDAEKRKKAIDKRIEKLQRKQGLSSPTAVTDMLTTRISEIGATIRSMDNDVYAKQDEDAYIEAERDVRANPTSENKARYEAQKQVHDARKKKREDLIREKDTLEATRESIENIQNEPQQNESKIQELDGKIAAKRGEDAKFAEKDAKLAKKQESITAAATSVNDKYDKLTKMRSVLDAIEAGENISQDQIEEFNNLNLPGGAKKIGGAISSIKGHVGKREELQTELTELHETGKGASKGKGAKLTKGIEDVNEQLGGEVKVVRAALDKEIAVTDAEIKEYMTQMYETEKDRREVETQRKGVQNSIKSYETQQEQLRENTSTNEARLQQAAAVGASIVGYNYNPRSASQPQSESQPKQSTTQTQVNANNVVTETRTKTVEEEKVKVATPAASNKSETVSTSGVRERKADDKGVKIDRGEWSEGAKVMADEISDAVASAAKKVLSGERGTGNDTGLKNASEVSNITQNVSVTNAEKANGLNGPNVENKYEEEDHVSIRDIKQKVDEINEKIDDEK